MIAPLYQYAKAPKNLAELRDPHRGLWFERFFDRYSESDWKLPETLKVDNQDKSNKLDWIHTVCGKAGDARSIKAKANSHADFVDELDGKFSVFINDWHLATGLGLPHPVENGCIWHPTLGVPYLTGAAVKGLVRAWVEVGDKIGDLELTNEKREELAWKWFGSKKKDPDPSESDSMQAGCYLFFDAIPTEPVELAADVMTPHMGKWYEKGDADEFDLVNAPADWHDPVPIPFLVSKQIKLLFSIAPRPTADQNQYQQAVDDLGLVWQALENALEWLGAGAKTAVGYGYLTAITDGTDVISQDRMAKKAAQLAEEEARKKEENRKSKDPIQLSIDDVYESRSQATQSKPKTILDAIEKNHWPAEQLPKVFDLLEKEMRSSPSGWKDKPTTKKPEKDRDYKLTERFKSLKKQLIT